MLKAKTDDVDWDTYSNIAKQTLDYGGAFGSYFDLFAVMDVINILLALPNALQRVKNDGAGLLVLSTWEAPNTSQDLDAATEEDDIEF